MYPLKAVLIGCNELASREVRRELLNRNVEYEAAFHDVREAFAHCPSLAEEPRMFFYHVQHPEQLSELRRLNTGVAGKPVVALVEASCDPMVVFGAMRAGAVQVVPLPLQPSDFKSVLDSVSERYGYAYHPCPVIAVTGVTGGTGATTLAINLASEIAVMKRVRCVLIDLSLQMGMVASYLDLIPEYCTRDLLGEADRVDAHLVQQSLIPVANNFSILAGPHQAIDTMEVTVEQVKWLIDYVKLLADVIVLDLPCGYSDLNFKTLAAADQVVMVGEQKIASIRALKLMRNSLTLENPTVNQTLVVNRYDATKEGLSAAQLSQVLQAPKLRTVRADPAVDISTTKGVPIRSQDPNSPALADIGALARELLEIGEPANLKSRSLLGRLVGALGLRKGNSDV